MAFCVHCDGEVNTYTQQVTVANDLVPDKRAATTYIGLFCRECNTELELFDYAQSEIFKRLAVQQRQLLDPPEEPLPF